MRGHPPTIAELGSAILEPAGAVDAIDPGYAATSVPAPQDQFSAAP